MLFIIIAALIIAFLIWDTTSKQFNIKDGPLIVICLIVSACLVLGLCSSVSGYEEPIMKEKIELVECIGGTGIYVVEEANDNVTCRHNKEKKHDKEKDMVGFFEYIDNTEIVLVSEGSKPTLEIYEHKPKRTFFTFALCDPRTEYVFYAPESTVLRLEKEYVN